MALTREQVVHWLRNCDEVFARQRDFLTQLDTAIGDGDHGLNMSRGFGKVAEKLPAVADQDIGAILKNVGMTLLSSVGGASGPLFGSFFIQAAQSVAGRQSLELDELRRMLAEGAEAVARRGRAEPGDKTMCDVWWPVVDALEQASQERLDVPEALRRAAGRAQQAAEATVPMQARKGRASYLGERSIGHQDPGAASVVLLIQALARAAET